ncbi:HAD-like protein [Aureobasidium sp. EXF-12298]|nr:HAD-like protein [Aureobasidium sp. EXF-12298]KAI4764087.1 HAD-like protein [Aureobasidium sp. EXF-12344]KAI4784032.1 HAD-like protein [Aureobasidium sp. EXF-3400]
MSSPPPKVLLFDIGGVCVVSPFAAILAYEQKNSIPIGWINTAISSSGKTGAWAKLERGQVPLDSSFFSAFTSDLRNEQLWRNFYIKHLQKTRKESAAQAAEEAAYQVPQPPNIDGEKLYWNMMTISRKPDPWMWPALQKLRKHAESKGYILAALSNTSIFPDKHEFNDPDTADGQFHAQLRGIFDLFVSSAHVGMRKPDEEIYHYAIDALDKLARERGDKEGVAAGDIVFFDDIGSNLRTARQVGMRTVKVELGRADKAVEELERLTGLKLKGDEAKL